MRLEAADIAELRPLIREIVSQAVAEIQSAADRIGGGADPLKCYSEAEAAELFQLARHQLADERRRGRIKCARGPRGKVIYTRQHLLDYLSRGDATEQQPASTVRMRRTRAG